MGSRQLFCGMATSLALMLIMAPSYSNALFVNLNGRVEECFHEYVRTKRTAYLKIGVLESSGAYDVRLKAYGPFSAYPEDEKVEKKFFDQIVATPYEEKSQNVEHSGFNFESEHRGGWYRFCLDNTHDSSMKTIEWYTAFDLSNKDDLGVEDRVDEQTRQAHMEGLKTTLDHLKTLLNLIRNEQDYYRVRVHRHVQTLDSSNYRVVYYTIVELIILGAIYGGQSFLLHKWFNDRGYLSKRQWA
ncbi:uncharacterized protein CCR75_001543 [Bremia lactucae]|uniref:GOLD domain-containing protein n=1 Tax=Bremia lactucae TaxID=4779 RepID=A0A976IAI9_BRELC|nr:hypothetical protein CCR75_001543 [Bremia lactucae]